MSTFTSNSVRQFADDVAAKTSVPGGGAVAAYAGALAIALGEMAGNFTVGKKKYAEHQAELERTLDRAETVRTQLVALMQADAEAFEPLSRAYGIPADDPNRAATIEAATLDALEPPLEMMRCIAAAIDLLEALSRLSSPLLISDVGCGAALAAAGLRAAALNVFVNTRSLSDRTRAAAFEAEAARLLDQATRGDALAAEIIARLRS